MLTLFCKVLLILYLAIGALDLFLVGCIVILPSKDRIVEEFKADQYLYNLYRGKVWVMILGMCLIAALEWPIVIQMALDAMKKGH